MADYSKLSNDVRIVFSKEFKTLYYLGLFCLLNSEKYIEDRPFDHDAYKHVMDRVFEMAIFPIIGKYVKHPLANKYSDSDVPVKPDFTEKMIKKILADFQDYDILEMASPSGKNYDKDLGPDFKSRFDLFVEACESNSPYNTSLQEDNLK